VCHLCCHPGYPLLPTEQGLEMQRLPGSLPGGARRVRVLPRTAPLNRGRRLLSGLWTLMDLCDPPLTLAPLCWQTIKLYSLRTAVATKVSLTESAKRNGSLRRAVRRAPCSKGLLMLTLRRCPSSKDMVGRSFCHKVDGVTYRQGE